MIDNQKQTQLDQNQPEENQVQKQTQENPLPIEESNILQKKPSRLKKIFTSNLFLMLIKALVLGLAITFSGGILGIVGIALATTILVSFVGKVLVDGLVLRKHNDLNKELNENLDKTKFAEAKVDFDSLTLPQQEKIKEFLNLSSNQEVNGLNAFLKEETNTENTKALEALKTGDGINNVIRSVLTFTQIALLIVTAVLMPPVGIIMGVVLGIKFLLSVVKVKSSVNTIKSQSERNKLTLADEKTKIISINANDMKDTTAQLDELIVLARKDKPEISQEDFKEQVKIEQKTVDTAIMSYTTAKGFWEILWIALKGPNSTKFQNMVGNSRTDQDKVNHLI